jgi:hypothetical protein
MTREEYEAKYGQSPSISSTQPTNQGTPIKMTRAEYEAKYGVQEQPQEKGLLRRMGEGLISSEIAAGKMIGTAISSVTQRKNIEETIKRYNETGDKWSEMAKKETDPIKKQLYMKNAQQSYLDGGKVWDEVIGNENLEKGSSIKQVAGAFGGVALDVATMGSYGQAAKLAKTGQRLKSTLGTAIPTVAKEVVTSGAKSLAKKSAVGAGIGYGYDVTQSMQNGESLPDILTPGYGTLLGAAIPVGVAGAKLGYQGTKAAIKGVGNVVSKVAQHTADIPDGMVVDYLAKTKKIDSLIAKNATPEQALEIAQSAVRNLRKNMSGEWQSAVDVIKGKYTNNVSLDESRVKQIINIAAKFGDDVLNKVDEAGNITRINPKSMNVDDSLTLLKNINELYGKRIVRESAEGIPVRSFKDFFKKNIIDQFGGKDGEIATLYKNYSTKSDILNAADDIVKAYDTNNPIKQSTALGRIKSLFRENKGAYLKAIKDLEAEMGVDITSYITASELGKGLTASKVVTAGGAGIFSKKGIIDKVFEAVLFPLTTPKYARQLLKLSTKTEGQTMRQVMGIIEKQPSKEKTILESMFPQEGAESPAAVLNSAKNTGKTIIDTAKQKTLKGSINNPLSKKGSPSVGKTVVSKESPLIQEARTTYYHGTNKKFNEFKYKTTGDLGSGHYLTESPSAAQKFAWQKSYAKGGSQNVVIAEPNVKKTLILGEGADGKAAQEIYSKGNQLNQTGGAIERFAKSKGYDSVARSGVDGNELLVFDKKNIKILDNVKPEDAYGWKPKSQPLQEVGKTVVSENKPQIINPDLYKEKFKDYNPANHEKYSQMAKEEYQRALKTNPNPVVKFTMGGSGSGKSEILIPQMSKNFNGIILDGTGSKYESFASKLKQAIDTGKTPEIDAILPRIESAWKFAQKRMLKTGRPVPLDEFVKLHQGFVDTLQKIIKEFPEVKVSLKDTRNIFSKSDAVNLKDITDKDVILNTLQNAYKGKTAEQLKDYLSKIKYSGTDVDFSKPGSFSVFRQKGRNYMIASAENPMGTVIDKGKNIAMTKKFREFLTANNIKFHPQKGKYGGAAENSQLIEITDPKQRKLIDNWLQKNSPQAENIIVHDGQVVRYDPRTHEAYGVDLQKMKNKDLSLENGTTDFYSEIAGRKYRFPLYDETTEKAIDKSKFKVYYNK